ncbi:flagellar biosynthesis regulator FlhF [Tepidanaerobacter syntrophicus]|uniref:flagellar biosynthesis protein FlhF n=1 Tax=Tepidanaerobacter syntrophicus TaxID=224999 RepID=UPI0017614C6B|nr:flagellar biosynthesis protein FlhF [Tepidanaerobacter syntrophicus]GLI50141.1 flagellar biosynthesis regulator FlhF [Tepidanaerobacter syntrophicus]HHV83549.1 flagellar biosynthesis protein FlhF [Tepidanaerobacter syntrophicus]
MKIKTYVADNIQEAFYKVKTELGKDAVILQTKHIKKGGLLGFFAKNMVEVVAANDIDISSVQSAPKKPTIQVLPDIIKPEAAATTELVQIKSEVKELKDMINKLISVQKQPTDDIKADQSNISSPLKDIYNRMSDMEIETDIINAVISGISAEIKEGSSEIDLRNIFKKEIASLVDATEPIELSRENNIIAFVGPTGVGKTTTIAKIAAHFSLYKNKRVAMLTTDTFRVGAIEQLRLYGDLMEIPVFVVYNLEDMKLIHKDISNYDLLLVDTMGFNPNNRMQIKKIKGLLDNICPTEIHLVISASTKTCDLIDILNNYKELQYTKIIVTKLDETKSYGVLLNTIKAAKNCKLSYLTMGQNVPDDIEVASADRIADMILGEI